MKRCGLTLPALAQLVEGLEYTSVGMAIKRFEQRLMRDKNLRRLIRMMKQVDKAQWIR